MNDFLRKCRITHSWLGFFLMPWILIIGATGLYLNHSKLILKSIGHTELSSEHLSGLPVYKIDEGRANQIAKSVWPDQPIQGSGLIKYRGRKAFAYKKSSGLIILPGSQISHYFVLTSLSERTYSVDGRLLHHQYNFKSIFKSLHERGWVGKRFGTWLADLVAIAMVFFGISGAIMWSVPKVRRIKNLLRRQRLKRSVATQS